MSRSSRAHAAARSTRAAAAIRADGGAAEALVLDVTDLDAAATAIAGRRAVRHPGQQRRHEPARAPSSTVRSRIIDAVMDAERRAAFFVAQAVARRLLAAGRPGSIINMSSQMGHVGSRRPHASIARPSMRMEGMTKAMAVELGAARHPRQHGLPDLHRDAADPALFRERRVPGRACWRRSSSAGSAGSRT